MYKILIQHEANYTLACDVCQIPKDHVFQLMIIIIE